MSKIDMTLRQWCKTCQEGAPHPPIRSGLAFSSSQLIGGRSDPPVKPTSEVAHQLPLGLGAAHVADTSDDWYTPPWLFAAAGLVYDMDVCAPVDPTRRTCPARIFLTPLEDGLAHPWSGLVWMNPPYSKSAPWVERFAAHHDGLALLPATRSAQTQALLRCADAVAFLTGQFSRPDGKVDHNPWLLMLAARGLAASAGLDRVAREWGTPTWRHGHTHLEPNPYGRCRDCGKVLV